MSTQVDKEQSQSAALGDGQVTETGITESDVLVEATEQDKQESRRIYSILKDDYD